MSHRPADPVGLRRRDHFRVERIFLDEEVGEVESYRRRFERRVGARVDNFVSLEGESDEPDAPEPTGSGNVF